MRYPIPKALTRVETRAGNSRFITTVAPADSAPAAQDFIRRIRAEMPDATHHVYAYRAGYGASVVEGLSDDGEPAGTSGPPTMAVLRGANVGDVVLVTTRYFGGSKLGTGGLVSAYTAAAQAALASLETVEKVARRVGTATIAYAAHGPLRRMLPEFEAEALDEQFAAEVTVRLQAPVERWDELSAAVANLTAGAGRLVEESDG